MRSAEYFVELDMRERLTPLILSYSDVETLVKELAARLIDAVGLCAIQDARFVAIPRGGNIVLGMLSYVLDLSRQNFDDDRSDSLLVIVDDCSGSGHRFAEYIRERRQAPIVFAHLCSAPGLRRAVLEKDSRVIACVAAMDLKDMTRELYPDPTDYQEWLIECRKRPPMVRYHHAILQSVAFPWNEPDLNLHHHATTEVLDFWRLQPPDSCLKNWARLELRPVSGVHAVVRCRPDVAHALVGDEVLLFNRRSREAFRLSGTEAACWRVLAGYGDFDVALDSLRNRGGDFKHVKRQELEAFAAKWIAQGVFESINST